MIGAALCMVALSQAVPLTADDVGLIIRESVLEVTERGVRPDTGARRRALVVDLEGSNQAFEAYLGHSIAINRGAWLRDIDFREGHVATDLSCPVVGKLDSRCTPVGDARFILVTRVSSGDNPGELKLLVMVRWTERVKDRSLPTGFEGFVTAKRERGQWRVRMVRAAVG
jgi:hypothetical protein